MKGDQQANILHKVHKNVKYMISQIREIMRARHFLSKIQKKSSTQRGCSYSIPENPPMTSLKVSKESNLLDRYKSIRNKERPYISPINSQQSKDGEKYKETNQYRLWHESKQKKASKECSPNATIEQNEQKQEMNRKYHEQLRLPTIKNGREKSYRKSLNYCVTMSIDDMQNSERDVQKKLKTIEANDSTRDHAQSKRKRFNSQLIKPQQDKVKQSMLRQNIKGFTYQPWQNKQEDSQITFQS